MAMIKPWRIILREWSTWCFAAIPVIEGIQAWLPSAQDLFEPSTWKVLSISIAVAGIILKNIPQPKLQQELNEWKS